MAIFRRVRLEPTLKAYLNLTKLVNWSHPQVAGLISVPHGAGYPREWLHHAEVQVLQLLRPQPQGELCSLDQTQSPWTDFIQTWTGHSSWIPDMTDVIRWRWDLLRWVYPPIYSWTRLAIVCDFFFCGSLHIYFLGCSVNKKYFGWTFRRSYVKSSWVTVIY